MVQPLRTRPLTKATSLFTAMPSHQYLCPTPNYYTRRNCPASHLTWEPCLPNPTLSRAVDPVLPAQPYSSSGWFNRSEGLKGNCSMAWRDLLKPIP